MKLGELLSQFKGMRALIVGDLMLDEYVFGKAARISPEAPVMVIRQTATDRLPGGAANVARNLRALGAETKLVGVVGCDEAGELLARSLAEQGLDAGHLVRDPGRPTTRKTRILADHAHQVLRIDHEDEGYAQGSVEEKLLDTALGLVDGLDVVVMSDYLKGALTPGLAQALIGRCRDKGVPVVVNPKPRSLGLYRSASLVSLNRSEAAEALGLWKGLPNEEALPSARSLRESQNLDSVLVTLGESGMAASGSEDIRVEAPRVEVADPAGAGDTVIATVALGYAAAGFRHEVFELAVQTAACVVQHVGVATPSEADLAAISA